MGDISRATAERIRDAWPKADSLTHAMKLAGIKSNDNRKHLRYRRLTEEMLDIELPSINVQFASNSITSHAPSTLNIKEIRSKGKYIITSCTSNSKIDEDFLDCLEKLAKDNDAQIIVIPSKYKNPDKPHNKDYTWPERVKQYTLNKKLKLSSKLLIANTQISPTSVHPLRGKKANAGTRSAVYGHPQISLKTIPTPSNELSKMILTTGTLSKRDYSWSDIGEKADFYHCFGAVYIHMDGSNFHPLHINWNEKKKSFYFLNKEYSKDRTIKSNNVPALIQGDSHAVWGDKKLLKSRRRLMDFINPEILVWHDLHDHKYQSHHATTFEKIRMAKSNQFLVEKELEMSVKLVNDFGKGRKNLIIGSNHNDHLDKWIMRHDDRHDPHNAPFVWKLKSLVIDKNKPAFEAWIEDKLEVDFDFPSRAKAYMIKGIDVSQHGDVGGNGSKGSANAIANFQNKTVIGHSHCLTEDHQILIKDRGWIDISEVNIGDKVLSSNNGKNEYVEIDESFEFKHTGKLITIGGKVWRQTVTDRHNMFLSDGTYLPITEAIVTRKISEVPISSNPISNEFEDKLSKDQISKIIAVCADGSIQDGKWIRFHLKKKRKIERLKSLFGEDLHEDRVGHNGAVKISLKSHSKSYNEVMAYLNKSKLIPSEFLKISVKSKEHLISELKYWDGTFDTGTNGNQWSTSKKEDANIISQILTELGYRNTCKLRWRKKNYGGCYVLSWCEDRNYSHYSKNPSCDKTRVEGWGLSTEEVVNRSVFCISNKNKNFWVRSTKTGQVSLTGNSPNVEKGCYQVGTSSKDMGYSKRGYSSWALCDCIIYPNGKRSLIFYVNGKNIGDFYE